MLVGPLVQGGQRPGGFILMVPSRRGRRRGGFVLPWRITSNQTRSSASVVPVMLDLPDDEADEPLVSYALYLGTVASPGGPLPTLLLVPETPGAGVDLNPLQGPVCRCAGSSSNAPTASHRRNQQPDQPPQTTNLQLMQSLRKNYTQLGVTVAQADPTYVRHLSFTVANYRSQAHFKKAQCVCSAATARS
ncbi:hypothetical protein ABT061_43315 [Streptosporangium sp. NPDC002544]|uniref:hypothetical protein n=1 Tax=Streptosporangium sp. NPDC002544 TaxID=3154538 RepID=UPI0033288413